MSCKTYSGYLTRKDYGEADALFISSDENLIIGGHDIIKELETDIYNFSDRYLILEIETDD